LNTGSRYRIYKGKPRVDKKENSRALHYWLIDGKKTQHFLAFKRAKKLALWRVIGKMVLVTIRIQRHVWDRAKKSTLWAKKLVFYPAGIRFSLTGSSPGP
jgi:hypothetical protein